MSLENLDTFICGTCARYFHDIGQFVDHKNSEQCSIVEQEREQDEMYETAEGRYMVGEEGVGSSLVSTGGADECGLTDSVSTGIRADNENIEQAQLYQICIEGTDLQGLAQIDPVTGNYYIVQQYISEVEADGEVLSHTESAVEGVVCDVIDSVEGAACAVSDSVVGVTSHVIDVQEGVACGMIDIEEGVACDVIDSIESDTGAMIDRDKGGIWSVMSTSKAQPQLFKKSSLSKEIELVPMRLADADDEGSVDCCDELKIIVKSLSQSQSINLNDSTISNQSQQQKPVRRRGRPRVDQSVVSTSSCKEIKNKQQQLSESKPNVEIDECGRLVCVRCNRSFTRERHYKSHKCLGWGSDFIDPYLIKREPLPHEEQPHEEPLPQEQDPLTHEEQPLPHEGLTLPREKQPLPHEGLTLPLEKQPLPHEGLILPLEKQPLLHRRQPLAHEEQEGPAEDVMMPLVKDKESYSKCSVTHQDSVAVSASTSSSLITSDSLLNNKSLRCRYANAAHSKLLVIGRSTGGELTKTSAANSGVAAVSVALVSACDNVIAVKVGVTGERLRDEDSQACGEMGGIERLRIVMERLNEEKERLERLRDFTRDLTNISHVSSTTTTTTVAVTAALNNSSVSKTKTVSERESYDCNNANLSTTATKTTASTLSVNNSRMSNVKSNACKNVVLTLASPSPLSTRPVITSKLSTGSACKPAADLLEFERRLDIDLAPLVDHLFTQHVIPQNENQHALQVSGVKVGLSGVKVESSGVKVKSTGVKVEPSLVKVKSGTKSSLSKNSSKNSKSGRKARPLNIFTCDVCRKVFMSLSHIRQHCVTHTDLKPYKCHHCSFCSNTRGNLYTHMRKHTGSLYRCGVCGFSSGNRGHVLEHEQTHTGVRHTCEMCKREYSSVKSLINHVTAQHKHSSIALQYLNSLKGPGRRREEAVLHQCRVCLRKFKNRDKRDQHLSLHESMTTVTMDTVTMDTVTNDNELVSLRTCKQEPGVYTDKGCHDVVMETVANDEVTMTTVVKVTDQSLLEYISSLPTVLSESAMSHTRDNNNTSGGLTSVTVTDDNNIMGVLNQV